MTRLLILTASAAMALTLTAADELTFACTVPVKGDTYQRVTFEAKARGDAYQAVAFSDAQGKDADGCWDIAYSGDWRAYERIFFVPSLATKMSVIFNPAQRCEGRNVVTKEVSVDDYLAWHRKTLATLPKTDFRVPAGSLNRAPRTRDALRSGKPWRILFLGDSIACDTFNSGFQAQVRKHYPKSNVTWMLSVRGSTGCWYYVQPEAFKSYVADYKPDCVFIAGISGWHKTDVTPTGGPAIEAVGRRIVSDLGAEVVVMTPALAYDLRPGKSIGEKMPKLVFDPARHYHVKNGYSPAAAAELRTICERNRWPLWDMYTPAYDWLFASELPFRHLTRDVTHSGTLGKRVIGELAAAYFNAD